MSDKEPDRPNRCQSVRLTGQCNNDALPDSKYCARHGGMMGQYHKQKKDLSNYRLAKFQGRLEEFNDVKKFYSLRDEVSILRIMLEEIINLISGGDPSQIIAYSPRIADLATRIEKLVLSCNKLDKELGDYMDKKAVTQFAISLVAIISEHVTDPEVIETISEKIAALLEDTDGPS